MSNEMTPMQLDALKEVANIGAGNAAIALSNIINKRIDISIRGVSFDEIGKIPAIIGGEEDYAIGTYFGMEGDTTGDTLILFKENTAYTLIDKLMGTEGTKALDEMGESAIKEAGNILIGAYLNAMADFLEMKILPTIPHMCKDIIGAMLNQILASHADHADKVLVSLTNFTVEGKSIESHIIMILDPASMEKVISIIDKKLGGM